MDEYVLVSHGGSGNHGCEALVRTTARCFGTERAVCVMSDAPQEDARYGVDQLARIVPAAAAHSRWSPAFWAAYGALRLKGDDAPMDALPYSAPIRRLSARQTALSVGGDVYCYGDYRKYIRVHDLLVRRGLATVLLGCSLEPRLFEDPAFVRDMRRYRYISARESLTYAVLKEAGLDHVGLAPDLAFTLEKELLPLPEGFGQSTVGVNLSPLAVRRGRRQEIVMENFVRMIRYILEHTDCGVALIPHVVWPGNDDRTVLAQLREAAGGGERVVCIGDCSCTQLKGFIARCRFFVGARTHAVIAAYSSCVPTLALGYSVKARGIAADLFGTDAHYVQPVQQLADADAMTRAFCWLMAHEQEIRRRLEAVMPGYIRSAAGARQQVEAALGKEEGR